MVAYRASPHGRAIGGDRPNSRDPSNPHHSKMRIALHAWFSVPGHLRHWKTSVLFVTRIDGEEEPWDTVEAEGSSHVALQSCRHAAKLGETLSWVRPQPGAMMCLSPKRQTRSHKSVHANSSWIVVTNHHPMDRVMALMVVPETS